MIEDLEIKYSVGALLYSPALNTKIADAVINGKFSMPYSLAICLEDTISESQVSLAEKEACKTIKKLSNAKKNH